MTIEKKWVVAPPPPEAFKEEHPELPDIVLQLLWNRGLRTQREIDEFLNPDYGKDIHDPFLFRDMRRAVDRLFGAIAAQEKIVIHGDYDADGVSASIILTNTLRALGAVTDFFLPHRETDGYGLNFNTVEKLAKEGAQIIITCDCGISNGPEIARAAELGIDVIITDHHQEPINLPDKAYATIHPKIAGETYPFKGLAGGGVAFKLSQGLLRTHAQNNPKLPNGESHEIFEKWLLDMVAISSVADMVPLLGETRTLVRYGLLVLGKTRRVGLRRLMKGAGLLDQSGAPKKRYITAEDIGFKIAPRINAAGRMNHATTAFQLLLENEEERARELAEEINDNNSARQVLTADLVKKAREIIETTHQEKDPVIVIAGDDWPAGVIGLIASKIKDEFYRPTLVLAGHEGAYVGSGRSTPECNMIQALQKLPELFVKYGGHPQACGFTLACTPEKLKEELTRVLQTAEAPATPTLDIDAKVSMQDINWVLYDLLERFEPFGMGNTEPLYLAQGCQVVQVETVGNDGKHLRLHIRHGNSVVRKIIGFNCGKLQEILAPGDRINLVFQVGVNEWQGNRELQLKIIDLKKMTTDVVIPSEPQERAEGSRALAIATLNL